MGDAINDLRTLIAASKRKPIERPLVCPNCGGGVVLLAGRLKCKGEVRRGGMGSDIWCGWSGTSLGELEAHDAK